jgi:hypothetical protein
MSDNNETTTPLSDWTLSEDHEPPSGNLAFECETKTGTLLCERQEIEGGPIWTHRNIRMYGVLRWRVVMEHWGLST